MWICVHKVVFVTVCYTPFWSIKIAHNRFIIIIHYYVWVGVSVCSVYKCLGRESSHSRFVCTSKPSLHIARFVEIRLECILKFILLCLAASASFPTFMLRAMCAMCTTSIFNFNQMQWGCTMNWRFVNTTQTLWTGGNAKGQEKSIFCFSIKVLILRLFLRRIHFSCGVHHS